MGRRQKEGGAAWGRAIGISLPAVLLFFYAPAARAADQPFLQAAVQYPHVLLVVGLVVLLAEGLALLLWGNRRRRTLVREAQEREGQLRNMMDLVPGGICSFRVDEKACFETLYFNTGFYQMLGYSAPEMGGIVNPMLNVHPDDRAALWEQLARCQQGGETIRATFRILRENGNYVWITLKASPAPRMGDGRTYYGIFSDVDELKRLQENLEENECMLQAAMDHADVDYWIYDPALRMLITSKRTCTLFGVPRVLKNYPQSWFAQNITLEEDIPRLQKAIDAIDQGAPFAFCEVRERTASGDIQWSKIKMTSLYDAEGNRTRVLCTGVVCTQLHREIERYERQNERMRALVSNALVSARLNLTKNTCKMGPALCPDILEGLDGTADALFAAMKKRTAAPEQCEEFGRRFNRGALLAAYAQGTTTMTSERNCRIGGMFRWLTVRVDITKNPVTNDVEANIYSFDIDDQKSMEQIMDTVIRREYLMILRIDLNTDTARIFASQDKDHCIREIPEAEAALLGVVRDSFAGDNLEETLSRLYFSEIRARLSANVEYTVYADCHSGAREIRRLRYSFVWLDRESDIICCTMADCTDAFVRERRRSEALRAALEEARRANQAKSEFLSRMSHEIRTPMNAILGLTQLARENTMDSEAMGMMDKIQVSGEYLLGLINDVLDMSRIESGHIELHPETVNTRALLEDIQALIMPRMEEKGVRFHLDASGIVPYVVVDRLRIQQVYINILSNAVKFSRPGSEIFCTVRHALCGDDKISSTVVFRDQGCGMSPEFLGRVFEPFEQENTGYQHPQLGTGLGLAIVKKLVEEMGGTVFAKSELGRGSEFTVCITVPKGHPPEESEEASVRRGPPTALAGKRILLVEDHPINTEIAKRMLSMGGMLVDHAENGKLALECYIAGGVDYYDAILMDIRMPVMNGIEATKAIRSSGRGDAQSIPIIAMTANAFEHDRRETRAAGMNAHLSKPVRREELVQALGEFIK
ncbi:ATP-binding protein [Oscillibacter sp.]|uniref:PAS domain-containing hybrid sensor histidine kinase/response regulator n=1 Tax=Oscillibacter sp. TaxID=1945593 RepID=UPI0028B00AEB|nr:ATP-binding protein [Oscillibacter sp.]